MKISRRGLENLATVSGASNLSGGTILCSSNTYFAKSGAFYSLFGIPLWYHSSNPRMVIQPEIQPGTCWAMDGNQGYVTIQLAMPVVITAVSLEHIPREVSPLGRLDSAPREFVIMAQEISVSSSEMLLGKFIYDINQEPIQVFEIKDPFCTSETLDPDKCGPNSRPYNIVTLKVLSNHGNPDYTCIYRLRVHGRPFFLRNSYEYE
ncbi:sun domain-containing protein 2 [Plakobranchus ocellatus]|uniref:Sun domain-containing protein 2 n=1 Tax=Plakobranchus ocellatus TaxID=259542 RepID=A0AAV3ZV63_9GAST|nr:sun domain-containing protein 2 [Plakobranchus ocellatus]